MNNSIMKVCRKCGNNLPIEKFYKHKSGKYGVMAWCKECWKEHISNYRKNNPETIKDIKKREYHKNKERYNNYSKKWYLENKEYALKKGAIWRENHKDEIRENDKRYYAENQKELSVKQRNRYLKNRDKKLEYAAEYRKTHRSQIKERDYKYRRTQHGKFIRHRNNQKRRTRIKNLKDDLTPRGWKYILDLQNNRCDECEKEFSDDLIPTKDHILPISNIWCYGLTKGNVKALCVSCNSKKHANMYFLRGLDELFEEKIIIETKYKNGA